MSPRRALVVGGTAAALLAVAVVVVVAGSSAGGDGGAGSGGQGTSFATVREGPLSSQVNAAGTLAYAARADGSPYPVVNQASGTYTRLPAPGHVTRCGQVLYRVTDDPVVLLCGRTPAYRSLSEGMEGPDVRQLNRNLVRLGYATRAELDPASDYFGYQTERALEELQEHVGLYETGVLALGQAVFLPGPLRISKTTATLGGLAAPGSPLAEATSTRRRVKVELAAAQQSAVEVGDRAQVTLPDNSVAAGVVTRIGTVANAAGGSGSDSTGATLPVYITLKAGARAGRLEGAPVQAQITTAGVRRALIVPVDALVSLAGGRYAVETAAGSMVPVALGLFDDANGLVQVESAKLRAGQRVVVPGA
jgi:peptidoglycan hydrolase-like protein with peptidoglycan-binding domain